MTRTEKAITAARYHREGYSHRDIAARLGVSRTTVSELICDPDGSAARARKERYRGTCEVCGNPTTGANGKAYAPKRCGEHAHRTRFLKRNSLSPSAWADRTWAITDPADWYWITLGLTDG